MISNITMPNKVEEKKLAIDYENLLTRDLLFLNLFHVLETICHKKQPLVDQDDRNHFDIDIRFH